VTVVTLLAKKAFSYDDKAFIVKMVVISCAHVVLDAHYLLVGSLR
jgi:hypothetical protein